MKPIGVNKKMELVGVDLIGNFFLAEVLLQLIYNTPFFNSFLMH